MSETEKHNIEEDVARIHDQAIHLAGMGILFFSPIVVFWAISALAGKNTAIVLMIAGSYGVMLGISFFGEGKRLSAPLFWLSMLICLGCTYMYRVDLGHQRLEKCAAMEKSPRCRLNSAGWHCKDNEGMSTNFSANYCNDYKKKRDNK